MKLYIAAIIKDEYSSLLEWIAYHRVLGVDGFIIADNGSRDGSRELLLSLARLGIVKMFDQPILVNQKPQLPAYEHILRSCPRDIDLLAFIDADEFLLPLESDTKLSDFFSEKFQDESVSAIALNWANFGSSGELFAEEGGLLNVLPIVPRNPLTFIITSKVWLNPNELTAFIIRIMLICAMVDILMCWVVI
ncbi:TPA: glycosyltransferase family 2 protein [Escherichia coli]